jgi:hypothetical protein
VKVFVFAWADSCVSVRADDLDSARAALMAHDAEVRCVGLGSIEVAGLTYDLTFGAFTDAEVQHDIDATIPSRTIHQLIDSAKIRRTAS